MGVKSSKAAGLVLVLGSLLLAPGAARAAWSQPVALASFSPADSAYVGQPLVARDDRGAAVIAWPQGGVLEAAARGAGAAWSRPVRVGALGQEFEEASLAVDERGRATLAWVDARGAGTEVEAANAVAGARWGPRRLLTPGRLQGVSPQLALGPGGTVELVTVGGPGNEAEQIVLWRRSPSGRWSRARVVADMRDRGPVEPQIAVDAAGETLLAWRTERDNGLRMDTLTLRPDGRLEGPVEVLAPRIGRERRSAHDLRLAVDARGDAVLAWDYEGIASSQLADVTGPIEAAVRKPGARFGAPEAAVPGGHAGGPVASIDARGRASIVFSSGSGAIDATRHTRSGWTAPRRISKAGVRSEGPEVARGPSGEVLATWSTYVAAEKGTPETSTVESSLERPDGSWTAPIVAASVNGEITRSALATAANGAATLVWAQKAETIYPQHGLEVEFPAILETADFTP